MPNAVCCNRECRLPFQTQARAKCRECPACRKKRYAANKGKQKRRLTDAENEELRRLERITCRVHPH